MAMRASSRAVWMERPSLAGRAVKIPTLLVIVIVMVFPFLYVLSMSLSSQRDLQGANISFLSIHPTLGAYRTILQGGIVTRALSVRVGITVVGTLVCMIM